MVRLQQNTDVYTIFYKKPVYKKRDTSTQIWRKITQFYILA